MIGAIIMAEYNIYLESDEWDSPIGLLHKGDEINNEIDMTPKKFKKWVKTFAENNGIIVKYIRYDIYGFELEEGYSDERHMPIIEDYIVQGNRTIKRIRINGVWKKWVIL